MKGYLNSKIVGASIAGLALVAGAYIMSNFTTPFHQTQQDSTQLTDPAKRVAIEVTDNDGNGIEDWRDEFVFSEPVRLDTAASTTYEVPDTVTARMGMNLLEDMIIKKASGGAIGLSEEQMINRAFREVTQATQFTVQYDTPDVTIINNANEVDVRQYANKLAQIVLENANSEIAHEIDVLFAIVDKDDRSRIDELDLKAEAYAMYRDQALSLPVPNQLVKEHLDLINTLHALHEDVVAMSQLFEDPALAYAHVQRYMDDLNGFALALENKYLALEPFADIFDETDPALFLANFYSEIQRPG